MFEPGAVHVLVTDPEHAARRRAAHGGDLLTLGGGAARRVPVDGVVDMEAIDPTAVKLPPWHYPDPGRARDLAAVLVSGGRAARRIIRRGCTRAAACATATAGASDTSPGDAARCGTTRSPAATKRGPRRPREPGRSSRVARALVVAARLHPVAALLHVAPAAAVIARRVEEQPDAVGGLADPHVGPQRR